MKISILSPFPFGVSPRVTNFAVHLSKKHEVNFFLPADGTPIDPKILENKNLHLIHARKLPFKSFEFSMPLYIPDMLLKQIRIDSDILHTCKIGPFTTLPGYLIKKIKNEPLVVDNDDWDSEVMKEQGHSWHRHFIVKLIEDTLPPKADQITVGSRFLFRKMEALGIDKSKINYIPNGVDPVRFDPGKIKITEDIREKYRLKNETIAIFVGKFQKYHHILPIVDAFEHLKKQNRRDIICLIVGGGDRIEEFKSLIDSKGLSSYFIFTGFIKNVPEYLAQSDIALATFADMPTLRAASNLKVFEYMAMELPAIVTNVGDLPEYVDYGKAGTITEPDGKVIAEKLVYLAENSSIRKKLGKNARKRILEKYTWEIQAKKVEEVYKKCIK